jgi:hypothetical protein
VSAPCKLCDKKRAKRHCPGSGGEICPSCCGAERENSIDCPLDCEFLREARLHEKPSPPALESLPNADVQLNEKFLRDHEPIILFLCLHLRKAMETGKAVDSDAREALDALIRTYRTLESGLIYESRAQNPYAAALQEALKNAVEELRKMIAGEAGMQTLRDSEILGCLVLLQRLELEYSNGRRRGRAFLDFLRHSFPEKPASAVSAP